MTDRVVEQDIEVSTATTREQCAHSMSLAFRQTCICLGMSAQALDSWERIHVQSEAAIVSYFSAALLTSTVYTSLLVAASSAGPYNLAFRVPALACFLVLILATACRWRFGHSVYDNMVFRAAFMVAAPCSGIVSTLGYLCPEDSIPFRSSLTYTAVLAALLLSLHVWLAIDPHVVPTQPIQRVSTVIFPTLLKTLKALDACTDLSFLQVLAAEVCHQTSSIPKLTTIMIEA